MHLQPSELEATRAELPVPDAAFAAVFRDHFDFVYQNLRRLGVPPGSVEDAVQEVFLVVLRRPDAPVTSIRAWLFGIARRIAWRQRRSAGRQNRLAQALAEASPPALDGVGATAEREAAALLERFLDRLDDDKRAVFLLAELEQMTAPEIARALEVKENTVYSRLRAARQEFDRTFARVRLRERRATGEAALDERALLLSRARRADEPSPAARRRVAMLLWGPAGGLGGAGEAAASTGAGPGQASAWTAGPGQLGVAGGAKLGVAASGHTAWALVIGALGVVAVLARPVPADPATAPIAAASAVHDAGPVKASTSAGADEPRVPFARLAAAAERAASSGVGTRRGRAGSSPAPKVMSEGASPAAAMPADIASAAVDEGALRREAALMADARTALRANAWTRARELLARHAREFPAGALVEERRLSQITALCSLGEVEAARAEAARIEATHPGSALARKASGMCRVGPATGTAGPGM